MEQKTPLYWLTFTLTGLGILTALFAGGAWAYAHFAKSSEVVVVKEETKELAQRVSLYECERLQREIWRLEDDFRGRPMPDWVIQRIREIQNTMARLRC